ncbi:MAG: preprotein translocase subunit YajC [Polyangiales bacterium]
MIDTTLTLLEKLGPKGFELATDFAGALAQVAPVQGPAGGGGAPAPAAPGGGGGSSAPTGGGSGGSGGMMQLLFPVLIFVAFYFFLIRPQQKKQKELDSKLKKGDRVFTNAGIIGKIVDLGEKRVTLEISKGVNVVFLRTAIGGVDEGDAPAKTESKEAEKRA